MALELSAVKIEASDSDSKDVKLVLSETADNHYAAAVRSLAHARSAAQKQANERTIEIAALNESLANEREQANELEAELVTVKELLVLQRGRAEGLRATVDTAVNEKDPAREVGEREIQTLKQTHASERADFRTRIDALQASTGRERQVPEQQRQAMIEEHRKLMNALKAKYSAFDNHPKIGRDDRAKSCHTEARQPFDASRGCELDPSSVPAKSARTENDSETTPTNQLDTKRARTENNPDWTVVVAVVASSNLNPVVPQKPTPPTVASLAAPQRSSHANDLSRSQTPRPVAPPTPTPAPADFVMTNSEQGRLPN
ncbi:hypothetical protein DFH08DRAFT_989644 [Mycena albidolilacea]|uniref:Uncharacterized protein n=1 Tax=Mycena albidolilacea TaxID=1033008 RepID=A0AAD7E808_9AGAR|nr:hypothetical protein DFH08DRAFT_989644 [Mycena albidolilacea]